ncbi:MAG TPA: LemA family protein [Polyangiaceae bacterium]|nr:LemA family protein [Polyangiaceae bacterium]
MKPASALRLLLVALFGLLFGGALFGCQSYDKLVDLDATCDQKWADVQTQLQRRYDLIPNLVETVKGQAKFEKDTLEKVTEARASATQIKLSADDLTDPEKMAAFSKAQGELSGALTRLLVASENYPELKANAAFHDLRVDLEGTENRIQRARADYNSAVKDYNAELGKIRGQAINKVTGKPFKKREYFAAQADAQAAPKVSF